jgi:hypothetical protein
VAIVSIERNSNGDIVGFNYASLVASDLFSGGLYGTDVIFHFPEIHSSLLRFIIAMVSISFGHRGLHIVFCSSRAPNERRA